MSYNLAMAALPPFLTFPLPQDMADALGRALWQFGDVQWHAQTGSTNAVLLKRLRDGDTAPLPWLLGTHRQVQGRGRGGRPWQHGDGACLMMSCAFVTDIAAQRLPALAPLIGLVACEALNALLPKTSPVLTLKWPNDIQYHGHKLAGILVETTRAPANQGFAIVIGMGLNLFDSAALSVALGRGVADWSTVTAPYADQPAPCHDARHIAAALATHWAGLIEQYARADFGAFAQRYAALDALLGETVNVIDQGNIVFSGVAQGCDADGRLRVLTGEGVRLVHVGDISVRVSP
jgi:BirA family biotin operon repressor/biotin-[acetyl-CoA-carboxylase] ligase